MLRSKTCDRLLGETLSRGLDISRIQVLLIEAYGLIIVSERLLTPSHIIEPGRRWSDSLGLLKFRNSFLILPALEVLRCSLVMLPRSSLSPSVLS
jgi:hypothetical protein